MDTLQFLNSSSPSTNPNPLQKRQRHDTTKAALSIRLVFTGHFEGTGCDAGDVIEDRCVTAVRAMRLTTTGYATLNLLLRRSKGKWSTGAVIPAQFLKNWIPISIANPYIVGPCPFLIATKAWAVIERLISRGLIGFNIFGGPMTGCAQSFTCSLPPSFYDPVSSYHSPLEREREREQQVLQTPYTHVMQRSGESVEIVITIFN